MSSLAWIDFDKAERQRAQRIGAKVKVTLEIAAEAPYARTELA